MKLFKYFVMKKLIVMITVFCVFISVLNSQNQGINSNTLVPVSTVPGGTVTSCFTYVTSAAVDGDSFAFVQSQPTNGVPIEGSWAGAGMSQFTAEIDVFDPTVVVFRVTGSYTGAFPSVGGQLCYDILVDSDVVPGDAVTVLHSLTPGSAGNSDPEDDIAGNEIPVIEDSSPVTLLSFTAESKGLDGALSWVTASEVDNDRFEIERSLDGKRFEKIGEVKGNGTTTSKQSYSYTDKGIGSKVNGRVYYRLHQVDYDGTSEDSEVRFINFGKGGMSVYPNPTTGNLRIEVPVSTSVVKVYNSVGELVKQSNHNSDDAFEISELVDGVYNIRVEDEQGEEIGTEKIVKIK